MKTTQYSIKELLWVVAIVFIALVVGTPFVRLLLDHNPTFAQNYRVTQDYIQQVGPPNKQYLGEALEKIGVFNQYEYVIANAKIFRRYLNATVLTGNRKLPARLLIETKSGETRTINLREKPRSEGLIVWVSVALPDDLETGEVMSVRVSDGRNRLSDSFPVAIRANSR